MNHNCQSELPYLFELPPDPEEPLP